MEFGELVFLFCCQQVEALWEPQGAPMCEMMRVEMLQVTAQVGLPFREELCLPEVLELQSYPHLTDGKTEAPREYPRQQNNHRQGSKSH